MLNIKFKNLKEEDFSVSFNGDVSLVESSLEYHKQEKEMLILLISEYDGKHGFDYVGFGEWLNTLTENAKDDEPVWGKYSLFQKYYNCKLIYNQLINLLK